MSRIILSKYDNGEDRFVVGWDHPAQGAFWQEFNKEPDPNPDTGQVNERDWDGWEEVLRNGGMWPGIPLDKFLEEVPEDLRPLVTEDVMALLKRHRADPESGRLSPIDLTPAGKERMQQEQDADIQEGIRRGNLMDE